MSDPSKIGLFGGTFDPPHLAHINLTKNVANQLKLENIYFIPTAHHPLKENAKITPLKIRCEMLEAALKTHPEFKLSKIEIDNPATSYTVDTLKNFAQYEDLHAVSLYFILGSDNIDEIHLWKDPDQIFELAKIVVLRRPGTEQSLLLNKYKDRIIMLDLPLISISSTTLRKKISTGQAYDDLLPEGVSEVIRKYELYL